MVNEFPTLSNNRVRQISEILYGSSTIAGKVSISFPAIGEDTQKFLTWIFSAKVLWERIDLVRSLTNSIKVILKRNRVNNAVQTL